MKTIQNILLCMTAPLLLTLFSGCEKAPDSEVQSARSAIAAAEKVGATKAAPAKLLKASQLLDSALQEIEKQNQNLFAKDYSHAKQLLQEVGMRSQEAGIYALKEENSEKNTTVALSTVHTDSTVTSKPPIALDSTQVTAKEPLVTLEMAEAKVNQTYALYVKISKKMKTEISAKGDLKAAMDALKQAQTAIKATHYKVAIDAATVADSLLKKIAGPLLSDP